LPNSAFPECNGTGRCATSRASRPAPLHYQANKGSNEARTLLIGGRKKEPSGLLFRSILCFQTLDPSVKRNAQTERLLPRRSLSAPKFLGNFTGAGFLPSERLQGSYIVCRPRASFAVFHKLSPSGESVARIARGYRCQPFNIQTTTNKKFNGENRRDRASPPDQLVFHLSGMRALFLSLCQLHYQDQTLSL
jgi:hypothetical protein